MRLKRQHDTGIWEKPWFRELGPVEKCAFFYILDRCDAAGVWDGDAQLAEFQIGQRVDWRLLGKSCNGNLVELENGKVWVPGFCSFQYGDVLKPDSPIHNNVIKILIRHGLTSKVMIAGVNGVTPEGLLPVPSPSPPRLLPVPRLQRKEEEEEKDSSLDLPEVREDSSEDRGEGEENPGRRGVRYDIVDRQFYGISDKRMAEWQEAYPKVDLELKLRQVGEAFQASGEVPVKLLPYLVRCLQEAQDRAARR
jgi:hypothetical protein